MDKIKAYLDELLNQSAPGDPVWNQEAKLENKPASWSYIDGCMLIAVMYMYQVTKDEKYADFLENFISYYIDDEGKILGYDYDSMNSDSINEGKVLFFLYEKTKNKKYRKALDELYRQIQNQPRTNSGSFWHKKIYPNQIWLDGLYMVQPFYLKYELTFNKGKNLSDIMTQFDNVNRFMKDESTGLVYHAYDESRDSFWSNPVSGCSSSFWTRSIGWYAMALVDSLDILGKDYPEESEILLVYLNELFESLLVYEDQDTNLFYQVTDQGNRVGNYLETSGSSAVAYTLMKGSRIGVLPSTYFKKGKQILFAIVENKLVKEDNQFVLKDICLVAGLGGMPGKGNYKLRDGSYEYYISEPIVKNDAKGIAPLVYAYTEYLQI